MSEDAQWWMTIALATGFVTFVFWIIYTAMKTKELSEEDIPYENYPCPECGNYTIYKPDENSWKCDCCNCNIGIDLGRLLENEK